VYGIFSALLIAAIGIGSYVQARRAGVWSWREFALTLAGIALILILVLPWELFLMGMGPKHAGLATVLTVIPIAIGVALLARYLNRRRKTKMY
jgi:hypothetical protein